MSKYEVREEMVGDTEFHAATVFDGDGTWGVSFRVADYGLALAREKAEAECAFLNAKAATWEAIELDDGPNHRVVVRNKTTGVYVGWFYVKDFGFDLARTEAARLCQMLNERDAKGAA